MPLGGVLPHVNVAKCVMSAFCIQVLYHVGTCAYGVLDVLVWQSYIAKLNGGT